MLGKLDDHSRAVMTARFAFAEDTIRLAAALRPALGTRGVPEHVYAVDNGRIRMYSVSQRSTTSWSIPNGVSMP